MPWRREKRYGRALRELRRSGGRLRPGRKSEWLACLSLLFSELGHATRKKGNRTPGLGMGGLRGNGFPLGAAQGLGGGDAGRELAVQRPEDRMGISIRDRRERANDVGRACGQESTAEGESARLRRAGTT